MLQAPFSHFFSLLLMRKTTFQWSKMVSEAIFPTNRGMLVFRSGLRYSFWALEVLEMRVRKRFMEKCKKNHNHFAKFGGKGDPEIIVIYIYFITCISYSKSSHFNFFSVSFDFFLHEITL